METNAPTPSDVPTHARSRFDGRRFHNPAGPAGRGLRHFIKWMVGGPRRRRWPQAASPVADALPPRLAPEGAVAATFIGHSTFLVQAGAFNVLTDPVYSHRVGPFNLGGPRRVHPPAVPLAHLPPIHAVLLSHNHYDHTDLPTLRRLQEMFDPVIVASRGNGASLRRCGFKRVLELDWWQSVAVAPELRAVHTPAQHFSSRTLWDRDRTLWGGFVLETRGARIYFAGDSGYGEHFRWIGERLGPMDLALIPIGAYEPRWFMQAAHINPEEAVRVHLEVRARKSVGMHFGTFQLTCEAVDAPARHLAEALEDHRLGPQDFVVPRFGQTIVQAVRRSGE